jgi:hypothetical protein
VALAKSSRAAKEVKPLEPVTRLTMIFRELAIEGKKSWRNWVVFAQHCADEDDAEMQKVMECYRGLKKREQQTASPEFVCDLAGVNPNDLAAEIFRSYLSYASDAANLIEAASRPEVVRKSVQFAKEFEGHRDRKMLFEHSGFLPQKTGGGIHVSANASAETKTAVIHAPELESMEANTLRFTKTLKSAPSNIIGAPVIAGPVAALSDTAE